MPFPKLSWSAFKDPFNLLTLGLAIYGIVTSYVIFNKSQQRREISYRFVSRTKVYDSSSSSPKLSLLNADKSPVTNDVYVTSLQFWNSGTMQIEPGDIRRPLQITLYKGNALLDWRVAHVLQDSDVCHFRLVPVQTNGPVSSLIYAWDHCDTNRGCQIQILFAGDSASASRGA